MSYPQTVNQVKTESFHLQALHRLPPLRNMSPVHHEHHMPLGRGRRTHSHLYKNHASVIHRNVVTSSVHRLHLFWNVFLLYFLLWNPQKARNLIPGMNYSQTASNVWPQPACRLLPVQKFQNLSLLLLLLQCYLIMGKSLPRCAFWHLQINCIRHCLAG